MRSVPIAKPSLNTVQILGWSRSNQNQPSSLRDSNARKLSRSVMNYEILLDGSHSNLDMQRWKEGYPVGTLFLASAIYLDSQSQSRVKVEGPQ